MTHLAGMTDSSGQFSFRGFRGTYRITAEAGGKTVTQPLVLTKGKAQDLSVVLPSAN